MAKTQDPPLIKSSLAQEPWRFVCVSCGSTALAVRKQQFKKNKSSGIETIRWFDCMSCGENSKSAYDKKSGFNRHLDEIYR